MSKLIKVKTVSANYESWTEPRIGKTRAAVGTMSSETIEAKYAEQIINLLMPRQTKNNK